MSTYEEEHNISEVAAESSQTNTRTHQTLSSLLQDFFENTNSTTSLAPESVQVDQFVRALGSGSLGDIPLREQLLEQLSTQKDVQGVSQEYIDSLERVPNKLIKPDQTCSICTNDFLDDPHPLIVRLPCEGKHRFDLECIAPWLKVHSTCPLCRKDLLEKRRFNDLPEDSEEEEEDWDMYG